MKSFNVDNKGFSLTELMFAMTILAFGLLALAQMQMMSMRGTTSAREFSTATKIAREGMERFKIPGAFNVSGYTGGHVKITALIDHNETNTSLDAMAPDIDSDTDILTDLVNTNKYDTIELFVDRTNDTPPEPMSLTNPSCVEYYHRSGDCSGDISAGDWDFVRITNVKNWPLNTDLHEVIIKEVNVIVLWEERGYTRSVSIRTLIGRKDNDFY